MVLQFAITSNADAYCSTPAINGFNDREIFWLVLFDLYCLTAICTSDKRLSTTVVAANSSFSLGVRF